MKSKNQVNKKMKSVIAFVLACMLFFVAGCSSVAATSSQDGSSDSGIASSATANKMLDTDDLSGGVAVTVDGVQIGENAITSYIEIYRTSNNLISDDDWGTWIIESGLTLDGLRADTIDYYVSKELITADAQTKGVTVDESVVTDELNKEKSTYGTDERWQAYLTLNCFNEDVIKDQIRFGLLQEALKDFVTADVTVSDEDLLQYIQTTYDDYSDAVSLSDIPDTTIDEASEYMLDYLKEQKFSDYVTTLTNNANIEKENAPEGLTYYIDLTPYEQAYYSQS